MSSSETVEVCEGHKYCDDNRELSYSHSSPFSDPVFRQLSRLNGEINRMKLDEIVDKLKHFKLDYRGNKDVLKKRLKTFYKEQHLKQAQLFDKEKANKCRYKFICVIDFEATCEALNSPTYPHEIIEFPAILIDTGQRKIVDSFHEYAKPTKNPSLSDFCKMLTGITQEQVDNANEFSVVLDRFMKWKEKHYCRTGQSFVVVTDGPWDMGRFLALQCEISGLPFPAFGRKWINIRKSYSNFYKTKRYPLATMLELLGMTFEGQPHCGYDDAKNIAKVALQMLKDGASLRINERINWNSLPKIGKKPGDLMQAVVPVSRTELKVSQSGEFESDDNLDVDSADEYLHEINERKSRVVNDALELLSKLDVDPAVAGTEAILLEHRHASNRPYI